MTLFADGPSNVRPVQSSLTEGMERPVGPMPESFWIGDNAGLISAIAPLYLGGSVLDVTYGRGAWWKRYKPAIFAHHDLAEDGVDFRALPYEDASWDAVCFDPPYIPSHATHTSTKRAVTHRAAYGLMETRSRAETEALIADGLAECARVSRQWVLAKCCDYAENPTSFRLGHVTTIVAGEACGLRVHDLLVHAYPNGGGPTNNKLRVVRRTRRTHTYLVVFDARPRRSRKKAALSEREPGTREGDGAAAEIPPAVSPAVPHESGRSRPSALGSRSESAEDGSA